MTQENIDEVFDLVQRYENVIERSQVVTIEDIAKKGYVLSVNSYIEKKAQEVASPEEVKAHFYEALENVYRAEKELKELLIAGGYISE